MKFQFVLLLFSLLFGLIHCQILENTPKVARAMGSSGGEIWHAITVHGTSLALAGVSNGQPGLNNELGNEDCMIAVSDINGNLNFIEIFGGSGDERYLTIASDGTNLVAAGYTRSITFEGTTVDGTQDCVFARHNSLSGALINFSLVGAGPSDVCTARTITYDSVTSQFITVGEYNASPATFITNPTTLVTTSSTLETTPNDAYVQSFAFIPGTSPILYFGVGVSEGDIFGQNLPTGPTEANFFFYRATTTSPSSYFSQGILGTNGNYDSIYDVVISSDAAFAYVVGFTDGVFPSANTGAISDTSGSALITKIDLSNNNIVASNQIGPSLSLDRWRSVQLTPDDSIVIVVGETEASLGASTDTPGSNNEDCVIGVLDAATLTLSDTVQFGTTASQGCYITDSVYHPGTGDYFFTGQTGGVFSQFTLGAYSGQQDGFFLRWAAPQAGGGLGDALNDLLGGNTAGLVIGLLVGLCVLSMTGYVLYVASTRDINWQQVIGIETADPIETKKKYVPNAGLDTRATLSPAINGKAQNTRTGRFSKFRAALFPKKKKKLREGTISPHIAAEIPRIVPPTKGETDPSKGGKEFAAGGGGAGAGAGAGGGGGGGSGHRSRSNSKSSHGSSHRKNSTSSRTGGKTRKVSTIVTPGRAKATSNVGEGKEHTTLDTQVTQTAAASRNDMLDAATVKFEVATSGPQIGGTRLNPGNNSPTRGRSPSPTRKGSTTGTERKRKKSTHKTKRKKSTTGADTKKASTVGETGGEKAAE